MTASSREVSSAACIWLAAGAFILTRVLILCYPDRAHSTLGLNVIYGTESAVASRTGVSFYDLHAANVRQQRASDARKLLPPDPGETMVEYPPLAITWMALPAHVLGWAKGGNTLPDDERLLYIRLTQAGLAAADLMGFLAVFWVLYFQFRAPAMRTALGLGLYTVCGALLYPVLYGRMDIIVGAMIAAALAALLSRLPWVVSVALLALAINFKVVAIIIAPVWLIGSLACGKLRQSWLRQAVAVTGRAAALAALTLLMFVPYLASNGARSLQFLRYHAARGIQVESFAADVLLLFRVGGLPLRADFSYGSFNLAGPGAGAVTVVVSVLGAVFMLWALWRFWRAAVAAAETSPADMPVARAVPDLAVRYAVLFLAIGVCSAKVFSPQYLLWFLGIIPLALLGEKLDRNLQLCFVLTCVATTLVYPILYYSEIVPITNSSDGVPRIGLPSIFGTMMLVLRNGLFLWVTIMLWRSHRRQVITPTPQTATALEASL